MALCLILSGTLWGSWAKGLSVPHFFDSRQQPSFSLHDFPWVPRGRFKQLLIREGRGWKTREKQARAALGQSPIFPLTDTGDRQLSLSHSAETEPPSRWEKLAINGGMLPTSMETPDQLDLKIDHVDSYLSHHQPTRRMSVSWSRPLWTITIKLVTVFPKPGYLVLRALAYCVPLCLAKQ